jgi:hypothetical protein
MKFLLFILVLPSLSFASTCKIKTLEYADGWLSNEMKQTFATKGYTLVSPYEDVEVDYTLKYELKTYGIYPCGAGLFTCTGSKRFANFALNKINSTEKSIIEIEVSSKKKEWADLRSDVEVHFNKKINKLSDCK